MNSEQIFLLSKRFKRKKNQIDRILYEEFFHAQMFWIGSEIFYKHIQAQTHQTRKDKYTCRIDISEQEIHKMNLDYRKCKVKDCVVKYKVLNVIRNRISFIC